MVLGPWHTLKNCTHTQPHALQTAASIQPAKTSSQRHPIRVVGEETCRSVCICCSNGCQQESLLAEELVIPVREATADNSHTGTDPRAALTPHTDKLHTLTLNHSNTNTSTKLMHTTSFDVACT